LQTNELRTPWKVGILKITRVDKHKLHYVWCILILWCCSKQMPPFIPLNKLTYRSSSFKNTKQTVSLKIQECPWLLICKQIRIFPSFNSFNLWTLQVKCNKLHSLLQRDKNIFLTTTTTKSYATKGVGYMDQITP